MALGKVRRSQVITTYGPGAMVAVDDESFMIAGTDSWFGGAAPEQSALIFEPRLAGHLGVKAFALPPSSDDALSRDLPVVRFPRWYSCSECRRLAPYHRLADQSGKCVCGGRLRTSRFVAICQAGHTSDFPYMRWVHEGSEGEGTHDLFIENDGTSSGLANIRIRCSCGRNRTMEGAVGKHALKTVSSCLGSRPWLVGVEREIGCDKPLRGSQRGAATVWQSMVASAISIPPWSQDTMKFVEANWFLLGAIPDDQMHGILDRMLEGSPFRFSVDEVLGAIAERKELESGAPIGVLQMLRQEYEALCRGTDEAARQGEFECHRATSVKEMPQGIEYVNIVSRLREVRALSGFYRMTSGSGQESTKCGLSFHRRDWLPAVEVIGEGLFLKFDEKTLSEWEETEEVKARVMQLASGDADNPMFSELPGPSARLVAIHTLAHLLMDRWSLECGYSTGSLRERIYVGDDMAGLLIYTATSDSQGSMGGVVGMAKDGRFELAFRAAIDGAAWCSNDPVCAERGPNGFGSLNRAACHSCTLVPETSCTLMNTLLDRALVVGLESGLRGLFGEADGLQG